MQFKPSSRKHHHIYISFQQKEALVMDNYLLLHGILKLKMSLPKIQSIQPMKRIKHHATFSLMVSSFMFDEKVRWIKAAPYAHA